MIQMSDDSFFVDTTAGLCNSIYFTACVNTLFFREAGHCVDASQALTLGIG